MPLVEQSFAAEGRAARMTRNTSLFASPRRVEAGEKLGEWLEVHEAMCLVGQKEPAGQAGRIGRPPDAISTT